MSPKAQRIAIAEACGFKPNPNNPGKSWCNYSMPGGGFLFSFDQLPDYTGSLDAMHEAEKVLYRLGWDKADEYLKTLYKISQDPHICQLSHSIDYVSSTAAKRAEAFLRTLNLWVDTL
jgi:hypothetical protein